MPRRSPPPIPPDEDPAGAPPGVRDRRPGPVEGLFQDLLRRAATIGFGGFFLTEEAIRKALADVVPPDWVQFVVRQSEDMRGELIDRLAQEFGSWMRRTDPETFARSVLDDYHFSIQINVSVQPRREAEMEDAPESTGKAAEGRPRGERAGSGRMARNR